MGSITFVKENGITYMLIDGQVVGHVVAKDAMSEEKIESIAENVVNEALENVSPKLYRHKLVLDPNNKYFVFEYISSKSTAYTITDYEKFNGCVGLIADEAFMGVIQNDTLLGYDGTSMIADITQVALNDTIEEL